MDTIRGVVTHINFEDRDTGAVIFTAQLETDRGLVPAKIVGIYNDLKEGDAFSAEATWQTGTYRGKPDDKYRAKTIKPDLPRTPAGAERFLNAVFDTSRGTFGISPEAVAKLVRAKGAVVLQMALRQPSMLVEMSSDPVAYAKTIEAAWQFRTQGMQAVSVMQASGVESRVIDRIISAWQREAMSQINLNPYLIARIPKVTFSEADKLGRYLGVAPEDHRRLTACVNEALLGEEAQGSTCASVDVVLDRMAAVSGVTRSVLISFLRKAASIQDHDLALVELPSGPTCAHTKMYNAEVDIFNGMMKLLFKGKRTPLSAVQSASTTMFSESKFRKFDPIQRAAVEMAASEPFSIITGGPGTGKSTVMEAVVELISRLDKGPILLAAPTGKAAKRLAETTGKPSATVHRTLKARGGNGQETSFAVNADNPLPKGCTIIIDESSMLDAQSMSALMQAMPPDGRIVIVGDRNQLPSVGPGAVLSDLLLAEVQGRPVVPSVSLVNVYRQDKDSGIALGAAKICVGIVPELGPDDRGGVSFHEIDQHRLADDIERLVCEKLPAMGYDPIKDIAILCPQAPGPCGTWDINKRLQARLNPNAKPLPGVALNADDDRKMPIPMLGDRVMLVENDASKDIMNGDVGTIVGSGTIDNGKRNTIKVQFDSGQTVEHPAAEWRSLILAYAGTIHKSQGSQYPVVVMPMTPSHEKMLERRLVYTGWTRAQKRLFLLGNKQSLERGVEKIGTPRNTLLSQFMKMLTPDRAFHPSSPDWRKMIANLEVKQNFGTAPARPTSTGGRLTPGRLLPPSKPMSIAVSPVNQQPQAKTESTSQTSSAVAMLPPATRPVPRVGRLLGSVQKTAPTSRLVVVEEKPVVNTSDSKAPNEAQINRVRDVFRPGLPRLIPTPRR